MKTLKIVFLACLVASLTLSCVTRRKCTKRFPITADTVKIVNTRDSIVVRDTTIYVTIPGETVTDSVPIPCPPPPPSYVPDRVTAETSLARAEAWWSYPVIKLELVQKDTTIEKRLSEALKEVYHWKSEYSKITVVPDPVKFIPKFYKFCTKGFFFIIIICIIFVVIKYKTFIISKILKR